MHQQGQPEAKPTEVARQLGRQVGGRELVPLQVGVLEIGRIRLERSQQGFGVAQYNLAICLLHGIVESAADNNRGRTRA